MEKVLITSALPYANGYIHLGHLAGAYLPADIYARYCRLNGKKTLYICGSDEHGVAITIAAEKEGVNPKDIIDKYHKFNYEAFQEIGMSFDNYSRTSNDLHHRIAKKFFKAFLDKGYLVEKEEEQFYDEKAKMFLPDRYVEGICPNCGSENARGDQCDNCGAYYNQLELKNPKSLVSGDVPVVKKTTHWYFRFDIFQSFLENYIESHKNDWKENVLQQTRSWLKSGLNERAITRDLNWGVKIDDIEGIDKDKARGKVLYVWFDAVLGYISSTIEFFQKNNLPENEWEKWWKSKDTRYIAFIGKDNIVFHTLIFPTLLYAMDEGYILPDNVPANEFLNLEGNKFSKSRNWSIDLKDFVNDFPQPNYIDALRYTLTANAPETKDSDFTWKDFQAKNNNELSAIFGNFINRTLQFLHKNFDGKLPELKGKYKDFELLWNEAISSNRTLSNDIFNENDKLLFETLINTFEKINVAYSKFRFRDALLETMNIARAANKYFNDEEPWKTIKTNDDLCKKTLFVCVQLVKTMATLFAPITPHSSKEIFKLLNINQEIGDANNSVMTNDFWSESLKFDIRAGHQTNKPKLLFQQIDDKEIEKQVSKLGLTGTKDEELISIEDFAKIQLRTAKILEAEKVKKSKKLIKLKVDLGNEVRQILAGVAEYYEPEYLVGKNIIVVANLKPAKLMGLDSQGMMLAASNGEGGLYFVTPEKDIAPGSEVR